MSSATYQPGETVDIVIRGAKVDTQSDRGLFVHIPGALFGTCLPVVDGKVVDAVDVTLVLPADGAPQPGDLWKDRGGRVYLAYLQRRNHGPDEVMLHSGDSGYRMSELCGRLGALTLVYRKPAAAVEPIPMNRRIDSEGDEWREEADGRWRVFDDGEATGIYRDTLAEAEADYGPMTNPDESVVAPAHVAVDDWTCSCGWKVDGFTAPEFAAEKLAMKHIDPANAEVQS